MIVLFEHISGIDDAVASTDHTKISEVFKKANGALTGIYE